MSSYDLIMNTTDKTVIDRRNDPPGSPNVDDAYLVADTPTGDWVGYENRVAYWDGAAWQFLATWCQRAPASIEACVHSAPDRTYAPGRFTPKVELLQLGQFICQEKFLGIPHNGGTPREIIGKVAV